MNFKIGDKVRIVKRNLVNDVTDNCHWLSSMDQYIGDTFIITEEMMDLSFLSLRKIIYKSYYFVFEWLQHVAPINVRELNKTLNKTL